jgi:DNA-binding response OmpR family regulator
MDQRTLAEAVRLALDHGAHLTRIAHDGTEAIILIQQWRPHLLIVDLDAGDGLILDQLERTSIRAERVPTIALTRRRDLKTKLSAFDRGVDDVLTLPFSPEELVARVLVIMRRTYSVTSALTVIRMGQMEIDILNRRVRVGSRDVHLTSLEQSLLYLLAANAGQVVTRDEIMDSLWGVDYAAGSNVVDQHVRNLRAKLQPGGRRPRYISTVPGRGYRFLPAGVEGSETPAPA